MLESLTEWWFQGEAKNNVIGANTPAVPVGTTKSPAKAAITVTPPTKPKTTSCDVRKQPTYPVKRLLGFSQSQFTSSLANATTAFVQAPVQQFVAKDAALEKPVGSIIACPKTNASTKQVVPHKKTAVSSKRALGFQALFAKPKAVLLASTKTTTTTTIPTQTTEHSEVMAVSHALQDELNEYLKKHPGLTKGERRALIQWVNSTKTKLDVCDTEILQTIHAQDQVKLQLEMKKLREETEQLKRACMDAEIDAKASRFLRKIDTLR
jgi:hypothetical protein